MGTSLTIRNLNEAVEQKLRLQAATHQRSMEAEAREILAAAVEETGIAPRTPEEMQQPLRSVRGVWKDRGTTDELMEQTRGEDLFRWENFQRTGLVLSWIRCGGAAKKVANESKPFGAASPSSAAAEHWEIATVTRDFPESRLRHVG